MPASRRFIPLAIAALLPLVGGCGSDGGKASSQGSGGENGGSGHGGNPTANGGGGNTAAGGAPANGGVVVTPSSATIATGATLALTASKPSNWSVSGGAASGSITANGVYTAPNKAGTFHVVATAKSDPSRAGEAVIKVVEKTPGNPNLTPGVWVDITPPSLHLVCCPPSGNTYGSAFVAIDPSSPGTIYLPVDQLGLWKTTDGGQQWKLLGDPKGSIQNDATTYLDSPIRIEIDPDDPDHLYATQGVRGVTLGFWVSRDGGETWKKPPGFIDMATTLGMQDMTSMSVDPTDFGHLILGSHSWWMGLMNAGIIESKDGGDSWRKIDPRPEWNGGSMGVNILFDPASNQGDGKTWLVGTDGAGIWRTTDAGANWKKVSDAGIPHGGQDVYYAKNGTLYAGAAQYPIRSKDNGQTWEQVMTGLSYWYYYTVHGDGKRLYTQLSFTGDNGGQGMKPYFTSLETDGATWTQYNDQMFSDGPFALRFDSINGIMYSANWDAGLWALKVVDP